MSDPQSILPEEIWNLILNCVDDPQDILSCFHTCTLFKNYLSLTRTTWAFSSVFPSIFEFLSKDDILQCRLVSQSWRRVIDSFMQSDQFAPILVKLLRNHDTLANNLMTRIPKQQMAIANLHREIQNRAWHLNVHGAGIPEHPNQSEKFVSEFRDNSEKNPFPSRAVVVIISEADIEQTLLFLDRFGAHIWSLGIVVRLTTLDKYQMVQMFWKVLNRVPNLKHLLIGESPGHMNISGLHDDEDLNAKLIITTTPELKHLKWIEMKISYLNVHDIVVDAFGNRPITIFGLIGGINTSHLSENDWNSLTLEFPARVTDMIWDFHMRSFKHLHLPLESINLKYSKCKDLKSIFDNLSKYGSTLRRLTLTFINLKPQEFVEMKKQANTLNLSLLPKIKRLETFRIGIISVNSTIEFSQSVDEILNLQQLEKYFGNGWVIKGLKRDHFACVSAVLSALSDKSNQLKRK